MNSRGDEFGRAEVADGDFKIRVFFCPCPQQGVVVGECYAATVFQCVEGFGILVEFQQFDFRMAFGEEGVGGGALLTRRVWSFNCATSVIGLSLGETTPKATFM